MTVRELITKLGFQTDEKSLNRYEAGLQKAEKIAMGVSVAIAGIGIASLKAFSVQEQAEVKLRSALQATGQEVDTNFNSMKKFASELQKMTTVGDEASLEVMQMATNMGLNSEQAQQATKEAIGLSKAYQIDLKTAIKATTMAQQGEYTMLNRYIPELRSAGTEAEKVAIYNRTMASSFKVAQAETETTAGRIAQAKNSLGDFSEAIGGVLAKGLLPLIKNLQVWTDRLANLDEKTINTIVSIGLLVAGIYPLIKVIRLAIMAYRGILAVKGFFLMLSKKELIAMGLAKIKMFALAVAQKVATVSQWALNVAMSANPIGLIILAIVALIGIIILMVKNWDKIKPVVMKVVNAVVAHFKWLWANLKAIGIKIKDFFIFIWESLKKGFQVAVEFMQKIFFTFADYFLTVWGTIIKGVLSAVSGIGSALGFDTSAIEGVISKVEGLQKDVRGKSFFGDIGGNDAGQIPPQAMAYAGAGAGGGVNRTENVNVNSNVSIQVPQGTPASQQEFLNNQARNVVQQEMQKAMSGARDRNRRTE